MIFNGITSIGSFGSPKSSKDSNNYYQLQKDAYGNLDSGVNIVFIGGVKPVNKVSSNGNFIFKGDSVNFGYNMGIENFRGGTLSFYNNHYPTPQNLYSYATTTAPDRIPGTFRVGSGIANKIYVNYSGVGYFAPMNIKQALIIDTSSTLALYGIATPSIAPDSANAPKDGFIQLKPNSTWILSKKAGNKVDMPGNYSIYNFSRTSTIWFSGGGWPQTLYGNVTYGNVVINDSLGVNIGDNLTIAGNLTISPGCFLSARPPDSANYTLKVQGDWTNNGTFNTNNGTVTFDSTTNGSISGTSVTNFYNLIVNKKSSAIVTMNTDVIVTDSASITSGVLALNGNTLTSSGTMIGNSSGSISGSKTSGLVIGGNANSLYFTQSSTNNYLKKFTVSGVATLQNGLNIAAGDSTNGYGTLTVSGTLNSGSNLTLKSDANGTAMVAASTGMINDTVTVERYFPAVRAWRFVGIPFSSTNQTINTAWQEGFVNATLSCPPQFTGTSGYGTEISYNNDVANGFDRNNTGYTSIQVYRNNAWATPASTYSNLLTASSNNAYSLFVRGDRNVCLTDVLPPNATTLRPRGILNQRSNGADITVNFSGAKPGDFILIGNPYAAPLNIETAVKSRNLGITADQFWVWNPTLGGTNGVGGYVAFSGGLQVPQNGDTTNYAANTVIQSGEAFMVQVTNTSGSITFKENDKSSIEKTTGVFGLMATKDSHSHSPPALYVNLLGTSNLVADGVAVGFGNKFSTHIEAVDAPKKWNEQIENMAIVKHDTALAIDFRPMPKNSDSVQLRLYLRQQPYVLQIFTKGVKTDLPAELWLVDKYLGTRTQLDIYHTNLYSFTPNTDTNSYRNRFMVVFNRAGSKQEQNKDKGIKTSANAVAENNPGNTGEVSIYPNPVTSGSKAMLNFNSMPAGNYEAVVYNAKGVQLSVTSIQHMGDNGVYPLNISSSNNTGLFAISVLNKETGKRSVLKVLVNR
jgi:hypothetical protein